MQKITKVFTNHGETYIFIADTIVGIVIAITTALVNKDLKFCYDDAVAMLNSGILKELNKESPEATKELVVNLMITKLTS